MIGFGAMGSGMAQSLRRAGCDVLSGGAARAAAGEMTMMTSGRPEACARCEPMLNAMAWVSP